MFDLLGLKSRPAFLHEKQAGMAPEAVPAAQGFLPQQGVAQMAAAQQ